jgi:threonine/homoserine/homoserine lactone efflux protein
MNSQPLPQSRFAPGRLFMLAFVTGFSGAIMPGPLLVAVIGQTTAQGFRAVLGLITGHALLELVTVVLLVLGLQAVLARPRVRGAIGLVGGAMLLWMGVTMLRDAYSVDLKLAAGADSAWPWWQLLVGGAAVCASNPYFIGWWATVGSGQLAHMAPKTVLEYAAFYLGHEASDYTWYAIVGVIIVTGRSWLSAGAYHAMIFACGAMLAALGAWFIVTGVRFATGRVPDPASDPTEEGEATP